MTFNSFIENKLIPIILVPEHILSNKKECCFIHNNFKNWANICGKRCPAFLRGNGNIHKSGVDAGGVGEELKRGKKQLYWGITDKELHIFNVCNLMSLDTCKHSWYCHHNQGKRHVQYLSVSLYSFFVALCDKKT